LGWRLDRAGALGKSYVCGYVVVMETTINQSSAQEKQLKLMVSVLNSEFW
jgi:hypothetical protein